MAIATNESLDDSGGSETGPLLQQKVEGSTEGCAGPLTLRIKSVYNAKEISIEADEGTTVAQLKAEVADKLGAQHKHLRLILHGKLLSPDSAMVHQFKVHNGAFIHCVISDHNPQRQSAPHTSIDITTDPPEYPEVEDDPATRRGFDRLRTSHGFSIVDVAAIRSTFGPAVQQYAERHGGEPREGESREERQYRLEEEWMRRQSSSSEFALNTTMVAARGATDTRESRAVSDMPEVMPRQLANGGSSRDFLWGFVMGFALGFTMLFWLWNIPLSWQQKMGIITGVAVSLLFSIIRRQVSRS